MRDLDEECAQLLQELHDLHSNPTEVEHPFNVQLFRKYLQDHPDGAIELHFISKGYPMDLMKHDTDKLCKYVYNICNSKRECIEILSRFIKEAKKGYIIGTAKGGYYQLNVLFVPKKNNETKKLTEIRVARHGSFSTNRTCSINDVIDPKAGAIETLPNMKGYIHVLIRSVFVNLFDLSDAFRQLLRAIDETDYIQYSLFGLKFIDLREVYGLKSAGANCQRFGMILIWIFQRFYCDDQCQKDELVHIDDFLSCA